MLKTTVNKSQWSWRRVIGQGTSSSLVLVCLHRDHENVNSRRDFTKLMLKTAYNPNGPNRDSCFCHNVFNSIEPHFLCCGKGVHANYYSHVEKGSICNAAVCKQKCTLLTLSHIQMMLCYFPQLFSYITGVLVKLLPCR